MNDDDYHPEAIIAYAAILGLVYLLAWTIWKMG